MLKLQIKCSCNQILSLLQTIHSLLHILFPEDSHSSNVPRHKCVYYDPVECDSNTKVCNDTEECTPPDVGKRSHCYASWQNESGVVSIVKQGCWFDHPECYDQRQCLEDEPYKSILFCCCEGDMCNKEFGADPTPNPPVTTPRPASSGDFCHLAY